jgi:hypothetical protein
LSSGRFLVATLLAVVSGVPAQDADSPIQIENSHPGTSGWRHKRAATDNGIEGYASKTSVNGGGQISFFINTIQTDFFST